MATYNENIYPVKMFLVNLLTEAEEESSASSAQIKASGAFPGGDLQSWSEVKGVRFEFDLGRSDYASSKRLKENDKTLHAHLTAATASAGGSLPSGSSADAVLASCDYPYRPASRLIRNLGWGMASLSTPRWLELHDAYENDSLCISELGVTGTLYASADYDFTAQFTVDGIGSASYKPYRSVVWEDIVPVLGGFAPSGGAFVNRASAQEFTFTADVQNAYDGTVIGRTTTFRWRIAGGETEYTIPVSGQSVMVPADTFPAQSNIEWRVECVTEHGQSAVSAWQTVTTTDEAPLAPINLAPQNVFLHNDEDNVFSWQHNSPNGTAQTRAELQISENGSTWSQLATVQDGTERVTVAAGTLTAGTKFWRVRTYNADNVAGEWSESAQIVLMGAPVPPAILALTASPRAYVRWSSADQLGWRVTFSDADGNLFDSGEQFGNAREYRADGFLSNGVAHYTVAVANEYGWSVTEGDFTVENAPSGTLMLSAQEVSGEAVLRWSASGAFDDLYLLRGGIPIAKVTGLTEYRDRAACGTEVYQILGTAGANYTLSNEAETSVRVETMSIFDVDGGDTVQLRLKRGEMPTIARSEESDVSYYHFAGQRLPTAYTDGTATGALSITVTLRRGNANDLQRFAGKLCCIRDKTGWRSYGVLERIAHSIARLDDVTLSFSLAAYDEAVTYD